MADPICRWRNATIKQVCEFNQILPKENTPVDKAHQEVSNRWFYWDGSKNFFKTAYQLALQLGLYYEDKNDMMIIRYHHVISYEEAQKYINSWFKRYYVPNPYTKSLVASDVLGGKPTVINRYLVNWLLDHEDGTWEEAKKSLFLTDINNDDILCNLINNYSDIRIDSKEGKLVFKDSKSDHKKYKESETSLDVSPDDKDFFFHWFDPISYTGNTDKETNNPNVSCRQVIYYGAPGTGKSHAINTLTSTKSVIRTTFHPDSDYSTFVGAYKPTTEEQTRYNDSGVPVIYHDGDHKGEAIKDKVIVYDFVEQAFLKAYEEAWKKFFANPEAPEDEYLVIEEINRGNCAQIFGDLFQLLDRNQYGYSEYPITADNDISKHLKDVFAKAKLHLDDHDVINHMYNRGDGDVAQKVLNGDILLLPKNLYIWATMNTSDQSLFPIDSAFKRRWDWKYQPITRGMDADGHDLNLRLEIDADHRYDWWSVISNINSKIIGKLTKSEDKKLGYFFCKANNGVINKDIFVEKVLFYLWNEILKDFEPSQDFLKDESLKGENDGYLSYDLFYDTTSGKAKIIGDRVNHLLANLKIEPWGDRSERTGHTDLNEEQTDNAQEKISE